MNAHVDVLTLAAFADGTLPDPEADRVREHLTACRSCMAAYADAVRYRAAWLADPGAFRLTGGWARVAAKAARPPDGGRQQLGLRVRKRILLAAAALSVVVVMLQALNRPQTMGFELPPAVLEASKRSSERGLVLPGAEGYEAQHHDELRSGPSARSPEIAREVNAAIEAYDRGGRGPRLGATVVAALLAAGELDAAQDYARECLRQHPNAVPLMVFAADARFRANDLPGAEELLRRAVDRAPRDPLVALDLAMVLRHSGRDHEAKPLFQRAAKSSVRSIASRARIELSRGR